MTEPRGFVWIASYPKSGNTWLRLALNSLLEGGAAVDFSPDRNRFAPLVGALSEMSIELDVDATLLTPDELERLLPQSLALTAADQPELLFRKVHDGWWRDGEGQARLPAAITHAAIHIVRDPRDVTISWAHHSAIGIDEAVTFLADSNAVIGRPSGEAGQSVQQRLSDWSSHAASWLAAEPRPLTIRYEDMVADPVGALGRVAAHCGLDAAPKALEAAVTATRFETLQAKEAVHGFRIGQADGQSFFRRGVAGGWRTVLTAEQCGAIERRHGEMMCRFGYG